MCTKTENFDTAHTCTLLLLLIVHTNFNEFSDDWHNCTN